jgi:uncharacterized membrane protein
VQGLNSGMDWRAVAVVAHILAAFWYVSGYVGTNLCTELARRTRLDEERRAVLVISGRFDRWLNAPGGMAVSLTGIGALWVFGYSVMTPWVWLSVALMAGVIGLGILYWSRFGRRVEAAMAEDDWAGVRRLLTERRIVLLSRLENLAVLAIVVLMVLRPA